MSVKRLVPLNFPALSQLPASGNVGDAVYITTENRAYFYTGTTWTASAAASDTTSTATVVGGGAALLLQSGIQISGGTAANAPGTLMDFGVAL
jgi:hypothetical protein